ncbi:sialate O-acetylesterase-like [Neocloeon triangulifer]|uniref:sialate O-acetylesterase-like n=1 Tax=Neocloeon triangulifer TaxID=2078957 RepID=UPI00286F8166|nr:sialate O-acetylesterase-like [Neocloeon triangulifer]
MVRSVLVLALCLAVANGQGAFRLANYYQNDMVLQMEPKSAVVWGFGDVGASIEVNYDNNQVVTSVAADGTWKAKLLPHAAGGPFDFQVIQNGVDTINFSAWFGDVWVCSGQSNMEMPIIQIYNATEETNNALRYQNIRLLQLGKSFSIDTELSEVTSFNVGWSAPTASNVPGFSALCLLYGERISEALGNTRPIGLIDSTWGGTRIEAWFSKRVPVYCLTPANDGVDQNSESALWNAMIAPLTKTSVRGAIWYQGENNVGNNPTYYSCHIAALVRDWKLTFVDGQVGAENDVAFPFGVVQIGPYEAGDNYDWGKLRFHQTADQGVLPNPLLADAFFAAAYDLTDRNAPTGDIHPRDKQTVADRLSNAARKLIYGEDLQAYGPRPIDSAVSAPGEITITFDRNIRVSGTTGFATQNSAGAWVPTSIVASTGNTVTVAVAADDVLLTYAYRSTVCEYKQCSIYSDDAADLPAQPWQWDLA